MLHYLLSICLSWWLCIRVAVSHNVTQLRIAEATRIRTCCASWWIDCDSDCKGKYQKKEMMNTAWWFTTWLTTLLIIVNDILEMTAKNTDMSPSSFILIEKLKKHQRQETENHIYMTEITSSRRRTARPRHWNPAAKYSRRDFRTGRYKNEGSEEEKQRITHQSKQFTTEQALKYFNITENETIDRSPKLQTVTDTTDKNRVANNGHRRNYHTPRRSDYRKRDNQSTSNRSSWRIRISKRGHHDRATPKKQEGLTKQNHEANTTETEKNHNKITTTVDFILSAMKKENNTRFPGVGTNIEGNTHALKVKHKESTHFRTARAHHPQEIAK